MKTKKRPIDKNDLREFLKRGREIEARLRALSALPPWLPPSGPGAPIDGPGRPESPTSEITYPGASQRPLSEAPILDLIETGILLLVVERLLSNEDSPATDRAGHPNRRTVKADLTVSELSCLPGLLKKIRATQRRLIRGGK